MSAFTVCAQHLVMMDDIRTHSGDRNDFDPASGFEELSLELLDRWVAGVPTTEDHAQIAAYVARRPEVGAILAAMGGQREQDATWPEQVQMREWLEAAVTPQSSPSRRWRSSERRSHGNGIGAVATMALGVAVIGTAILVSRGLQWSTESSESSAAVHTYRTAAGQRLTTPLIDGSTMVLAPATLVRVSSTGIEVNGEAYFTIVAQSSRPIIIRTRNAMVRVLGTAFSVRHYANELQTRVVVDEGKVAVRPQQPQQHGTPHPNDAVLTSRTMAQITDSGVTITSGVTSADYMGWVHGRLVFNRTALRDVVMELQRAYGVRIRVTDSALASQLVGFDFSVAELPVTNVLTMIGVATGSHYTYDGQTYVLMPGRQKSLQKEPSRQRRELPLLPQPERIYGR